LENSRNWTRFYERTRIGHSAVVSTDAVKVKEDEIKENKTRKWQLNKIKTLRKEEQERREVGE
jgi:hypothetical protein